MIGVTSSFTATNLDPQLGMGLVRQGWSTPDLRQGEFNQIHQACLSPDEHFGESPEIVVILVRLEDIFTRDVWSYLSGDDVAGETIVTGAAEIASLAAGLATSGVRVILSLPPMPTPIGADTLDQRVAIRSATIGAQARAAMIAAVGNTSAIDLIDLETLVNEIGREIAVDTRKWLLYRQPYSETLFHLLGIEIARVLAQGTQSYPKCIAVDCDNTLWGGVIGEDGIAGIELGEDFPGLAFQRFQEQLLLLKKSGVLLAAVSKNDEPAVFEVFDKHPGMVLARDDFAAWRVNWLPKSENLKSLSAELNFGLDAFVFIDDSSFEVAEVGNALPELTILQVPEETADLLHLIPTSGLFRNIEPTADDVERTRRIQEEAQRRTAGAALNPEDFLASLGLRVQARLAQPEDLGRVTQLINKTNQFNLTTKRRDESDVAALAASDEFSLLAVRVEDRFGDYGLVGVVVLDKTAPGEVAIDTLLLSCRVLGRGVEFAVLAAAHAHAGTGERDIVASYSPTQKNGQVADFYERAGFVKIDDEQFRLSNGESLDCPTHIDLDVG